MNSLSMFSKSAYARNILTYLLFNVVTIGAVLGYIYFSTVEVIENEVAEVVETGRHFKIPLVLRCSTK